MKKYRLSLLLLVSLLIAGCSASGYRYVDKGDKSYIVLDSDSQGNSSSAATSSFAPYVYFSSLSEMIEDIQEGNFTAEEKDQIAQFNRNSTGNISTMSLDKFYEPIVPSNYSTDYVSWSGMYYGVRFKNESTGETAFFSTGSMRRYDVEMQVNISVENNSFNAGIDSSRNANIYYCTNMAGGREKLVLYEITDDSKTLHVREYYPNTTSTVPDLIVINGIENSRYFKVVLEGMSERPSLKKLETFGLREYVETEAS